MRLTAITLLAGSGFCFYAAFEPDSAWYVVNAIGFTLLSMLHQLS